MEQIVFHPSFPRCEAKGLCKNKKHVELDEELQVFENDNGDVAYGMSHVSSQNTLMLPWLSFNEEAMNIPFPNNMAGLVTSRRLAPILLKVSILQITLAHLSENLPMYTKRIREETQGHAE